MIPLSPNEVGDERRENVTPSDLSIHPTALNNKDLNSLIPIEAPVHGLYLKYLSSNDEKLMMICICAYATLRFALGATVKSAKK